MLIHTPQCKKIQSVPQLTFCTSSIPSSRVSATFPVSIYNNAALLAFDDCNCYTSSAVHWQPVTARIKFTKMPMALPNATFNPSYHTIHLSQVNVLVILGRLATLSHLSMHMMVQFIYELLDEHRRLDSNTFHTHAKIKHDCKHEY